jgi:hypothetical protein
MAERKLAYSPHLQALAIKQALRYNSKTLHLYIVVEMKKKHVGPVEGIPFTQWMREAEP